MHRRPRPVRAGHGARCRCLRRRPRLLYPLAARQVGRVRHQQLVARRRGECRRHRLPSRRRARPSAAPRPARRRRRSRAPARRSACAAAKAGPRQELTLGDAQRVARHARLEAGTVLAALHDAHRGTRARPRPARRRSDGRRAAVGPSAGTGPAVGRRRRAQQGEEIPLALAHAAADGGQLDRARRAAQVGRRLQGADGGPLDRGVDLPPVHAGRRHRPRRPRRRRRPAARAARRSRRPRRSRRSATPGRTASRCPRPGRRCGPAPSRGRRAARRARPGSCPSGSRRAPSRGARRVGGGPPASARRARAPGRTSPSASRKGRGSPSGSDGGRPAMDAGSTVWMAARARPAWAVRAARAPAHSSSRRILRGIVSPSRRSTTSQLAPSSSPSPERHDAGHRHAGRRGRTQQGRLHPRPAAAGELSPRSICRMSGCTAPPAARRSKALVTPRGAARQAAQALRRCRRADAPARPASSSCSGGSPSLLDGDDRPPAVVELVQVLADAVAGLRRRRSGSS